MVGFTQEEMHRSGESGAHLLFHREDRDALLRRQLEALQFTQGSSYCMDARCALLPDVAFVRAGVAVFFYFPWAHSCACLFFI